MLVLKRKPDQKILIGDITITVTRCNHKWVQIGIDAPEGVSIERPDRRSNVGDDRASESDEPGDAIEHRGGESAARTGEVKSGNRTTKGDE